MKPFTATSLAFGCSLSVLALGLLLAAGPARAQDGDEEIPDEFTTPGINFNGGICKTCPKKWKLGEDNACYQSQGKVNYWKGLKRCKPNRAGTKGRATTYNELKIAAKLFGYTNIWTVGQADKETGYFDQLIRPQADPSDPTRYVRARGDRTCLSFDTGKPDDPVNPTYARFLSGKCASKCPVVCKMQQVCHSKYSYVCDREQRWEILGFRAAGKLTYGSARKFCNKMGGVLPVIKNDKALKAVHEQTKCSDFRHVKFWVRTTTYWGRGDCKNVLWNYPGKVPSPITNNYRVKHPTKQSQRMTFEYNADTDPFTGDFIHEVAPGDPKEEEYNVFCMFKCKKIGKRTPLTEWELAN